MKKKLALKDFEVKSFVTNLNHTNGVKGGTGRTMECNTTNTTATEFSCLQYISCNPVACVPSDMNLCNIQINTNTNG
ncbi:pinensin family lanthipeptide [Luteibaculum oceani]|uniref:Uncharacterized protein n=1 Tax=Luteibaculum oceani TaxID=1294296 RepID=A0A5C6VLD9_9FLAO|nr:pinensin family lanthipeptide [Luteibaculum oceani]TXC85236.1 hypothetical protein FRX97_01025 [Luteibaculum oceani]